MVLNPELLQKARTAGTELEDAERKAVLARAEYHAAVRRLHLAGGSLREIAQSLSISHQRIQQIVAGAGGTWWRRAWRARNFPPEATCTWCGRPPSEVSKLIAGPDVYICDACVQSAEAASAGRPNPGKFSPVRKSRVVGLRLAGSRCAFCGNAHGKDRTLVTSAAGHVCSDCLRVCRDILDASEATND